MLTLGVLLAWCFTAATAGAAVDRGGSLWPSGTLAGDGAAELGEEIEPYSKHPSEERPYALCPPPTKRRASCMAAVVPSEHGRPVVGLGLEGSGVSGGFSPADLRSAYNLPASGGEGQTVAITIAYDHPKAESDLATYRSHYGLPPCTTANGCFRKVNQRGEATSYPAPNAEWALETSLDLDMVSASCPECDILLVEADSNELDDLGVAVNTAAELGADVISNSWAAEEFGGETSSNHYFAHPGIPALFASGDWGYGVYYPAASPDVVAVGGTSLTKAASSRGWSESAWSGAGSGCSKYEAKPTWQHDEGCPARSVADASAVADPFTPVSVYDSYEYDGWQLLGGTSVATPLLAGVESLSSTAFRAAGPSAFSRAGQGGGLFDVTEGENGACATEGTGDFEGAYLCQAGAGYDGPSGWGTPEGPQSLPVAITEPATVASPGKATLHGSVDPGGLPTSYRFEYGETASYGNSVPITDKSAGSGTGYVELSRPIEGLQGHTLYHYRIVATNSEGTFHGVDRTFGTTKPTAATGTASDIDIASATLHGTVNPEGLQTTYYFEYGPTPSYGFKAPVRAEGAGAGTGEVDVSTGLGSLTGGTAYHYRLVAKNAAGVVRGADATFFTKPAKWVAETLPQPPNSGRGHEAYGVSCLAPKDCITVGANWSLDLHARATLAERWDGESWSVMDTPNPPGLEEGWEHQRYAVLRDVACTSVSSCLAVGHFKGADEVVRPFAERWDGSEWTLHAVPLPPSATAAKLEGIACAAPTGCTAVGYFTDGSGTEKPLAQRWDGSEWTLQSVPVPASATDSRLEGISCSSASECTAVGYLTDSGSGRNMTLAERFDGTEWSVQSTENPPGNQASNALRDVSCASSDACMAVGVHVERIGTDYRGSALAERWDGTEWSAQEAILEPPSSESSRLTSVSCVSSASCTAVGTYRLIEGSDSSAEVLGVRWEGEGWSVLDLVGLPDPAGWWHERWLYGVSCPESEACTAVGDGLSAPSGELSPRRALGEHETPPPYAEFSISPGSPVPGQPVAFDASSSSDPGGMIESYEWDFGDGSTATGPTPSHAYPVAGDYTVTLTVSDDEVNVGEVSYSVLVDAPPVASFTSSGTPTATQEVSFDASLSSDPDSAIVSYQWNFGDGTKETGGRPRHTYAHAGNYPVTLTVIDDAGKADEVSHPLTVADAAPVASFSVSTPTPTASELVAFDGSGSTDPDGILESYEWDFGDGSTGTGVTPSHTYAHAGNYPVTLTVIDDAGKADEVSHPLTVANALPVAYFTTETASPTATQPVSFSASTSRDLDGTIESYEWDFGDGSQGSGLSTSHTYAHAGQYSVTLVVTDNEGGSGEVSHEVAIANTLPYASFSVNGGSPIAAQAVAFDATASSDPDGTIESYEWDFGDGGAGAGAILAHTYAQAGNYSVTLTVTDDEGKAAEASQQVSVAEAPPLASFVVGTASPTATQPVVFDGSGSADPDGVISAYRWSFGDGSRGSGIAPSHFYAQPGDYTVSLEVTDDDGLRASVRRTLEIKPASSAFAMRRITPACNGRIAMVLSAAGPGVFKVRAKARAVRGTKGARGTKNRHRGCRAGRQDMRVTRRPPAGHGRGRRFAMSRGQLRRGFRYGTGSARAHAAGPVRLIIRPRPAVLRTMRKRRRGLLRVRVAITFIPRGGKPKTKRITVYIRGLVHRKPR